MSYLRFDYPNVGFVIDGLEDATVRFEFERELEPGQRVQLLTPEGNQFGTAVIEEVTTCPLRLAFFDMTVADGRNHPAKNGIDLQKRLWTHYPKARPSDDDEVVLIYFDLIEVGGPEAYPDPEDDPFACSICGAPLGESKRIRGEEHCDGCQREYGPVEYLDMEDRR